MGRVNTRRFTIKSGPWYEHTPPPVIEYFEFKILWDFNIQVDEEITARSSDSVITDKGIDHIWIIDVTIPCDFKILEKENEKQEEY